MTANVPALLEPLTPADCDLRPYRTMPLDVQRIRDSMIASHENPEVFRAAVLLWCAAWHQLPAASLPNDDRELAKLAGFGRFVDQWKEVRDEALKGFVLCSDGRLYHRVIAEMALPAWATRQRYLERSRKANEAKYGRDKSANDKRKLLEGDQQGSSLGSERNGTERNESKKKSPPKKAGEKKARAKRSPAGQGTRLPIGWFANESDRAYALDRDFTLDEVDEMETAFREYWLSKAGAGARWTNWNLVWRRWVRTTKERRDEREARTGSKRGGARSTDGLGELHAGFVAHAQRRARG